MQKFVDYTLQELENLVAVAPYSQYHQMLLAVKRNELNKSTLYQPYLGSLPELKHLLKEESYNITSISKSEEPIRVETEVEIEKNIQSETNSLSLPEEETISVKKEQPKENKKIKKNKPKSKKQETKKNKSKKKKAKKSIDLKGLSDFSKWLLTGNKKEVKQKKQKNKTKATKKASTKASNYKHQDEKLEVISEPLAQLLALQGHQEKAIDMYEKLIKLFPEKEKVYLEQINEIKK